MIYTEKVTELLNGLYQVKIIDETGKIVGDYLSKLQKNPRYKPVPSSLHEVTEAREMFDPVIEISWEPDEFFELMGIYDGKSRTVKGPLNHILTRMFTIARMLEGYIENYPNGEEKKIYTDPPLLQKESEELKRIHEKYFANATEKLKNKNELTKRFELLGKVGESIANIETVYPGQSSTEAYENFGIFHLFPSNKEVDITATSPGVIIPTEADPLRYKDSVLILKKNLLRPTYFEMLRLSVDLGKDRVRKYSANREGTAKNLIKYISMLNEAKKILSGYLQLGERFEIRIGEQNLRMRLATLIGDVGVVYSVRDKEQKSKIAHNLTVINPEEARRQREIFEEQWERGEKIDSVDMLDKLVEGFKGKL